MTLIEAADDEALVDIRSLRPEDVDELRLGWWSRIDEAEVVGLLNQNPRLSMWIPAEHEYVLVAPWRHRDDVVHAVELVAIQRQTELMRAAIARASDEGKRLFLAVEMTERRQPTFYERIGLTLLENVISYELTGPRTGDRPDLPGELERVEELSPRALHELTRVDWDAFPWLWRNSESEFRQYFQQTGVEIYLLREAGRAIGYLGITVFPGWGHIDRLAVIRSRQGEGLGRRLTLFAIDRLTAHGAVRVGLSTQQRNTQSQSLYSGVGFRRQLSGDYRIYGCALWQNESVDELVMGS